MIQLLDANISELRIKHRIKRGFAASNPRLSESVNKQVYWSKNYIDQLQALPMETPQARRSLNLLIGGYENARNQVRLATLCRLPCNSAN